jgi:hypothetical protein
MQLTLDIIEADYILIDEAPTVPRFAFEIVNGKLQELKRSARKRPFANHLIIAGGWQTFCHYSS